MSAPRIVKREGRATWFDCGCSADVDVSGTVYLVQCRTHEQAPAMVEALRPLLADLDSGVLGQHSSVRPGELSRQAESRTRRHVKAIRGVLLMIDTPAVAGRRADR